MRIDANLNGANCPKEAIMARIGKEQAEATPPNTKSRIQAEGALGRHQGREEAGDPDRPLNS